jgi:hypothetical protein
MPKLKPDRAFPHYRFKDLLAAVGSDQEIQDLIASHGFDRPTLPVIRGWRARNSVPSRWLPLILHKVISSGDLKDITVLLETPF